MASRTLYTASVEGVNLGAATALGVLAINGVSTQRITAVTEFGVFFNGTSSTAIPVTVRLRRISNAPAGTAIVANFGPIPMDTNAQAGLITALSPSTATPGVWGTAPTMGKVLKTMYVPPTSGMVFQFPLGDEPLSTASTTDGVCIECNAPAAVACSAYIVWAE